MAFESEGIEILPMLNDFQVEGIKGAISDHIDGALEALGIPAVDRFTGEGPGKRVESLAKRDAGVADAVLASVFTHAQVDERISFLDGFPPLRRAAEGLILEDIVRFTIRIRGNAPGLPHRRQGWHSDVSILDGSEFERVRIACWIPLSDVGPDNGTLEVVPGIRSRPMEHEIRPEGKHIIPEASLAGCPRRPILCRKGDGVFLDSFVPHRALPHPGDEVRWSAVAWMIV
jgi:hypothetical protein